MKGNNKTPGGIEKHLRFEIRSFTKANRLSLSIPRRIVTIPLARGLFRDYSTTDPETIVRLLRNNERQLELRPGVGLQSGFVGMNSVSINSFLQGTLPETGLPGNCTFYSFRGVTLTKVETELGETTAQKTAAYGIGSTT